MAKIQNEPKLFQEPKINIKQFLANYPVDNRLKIVFKTWFFKREMSEPLKTQDEWYNLFNKFKKETV